MKMKDKINIVGKSDFTGKIRNLTEQINNIIDGNNIYVIIPSLMILLEIAISHTDEDIRNELVDAAIKQLNEKR